MAKAVGEDVRMIEVWASGTPAPVAALVADESKARPPVTSALAATVVALDTRPSTLVGSSSWRRTLWYGCMRMTGGGERRQDGGEVRNDEGMRPLEAGR